MWWKAHLPPHRGARRHEPLSWAPQGCPGRASAPVRHSTTSPWGSSSGTAEGSLPWGTGLIIHYHFTGKEHAGGESSSMEHLGEEPKVGRWRHWASLGRNKYAKMEREDTNSLLVGTLVCVSGYGLCFSVLYIYGLCSLMHLNMLLLTFLLVSLVVKFVDMISVVALILALFCNYCFLHKNIECIILPILMNELLF